MPSRDDKGKPIERWGRKAMGLTLPRSHDRQAAESEDFLCLLSLASREAGFSLRDISAAVLRATASPFVRNPLS